MTFTRATGQTTFGPSTGASRIGLTPLKEGGEHDRHLYPYTDARIHFG